MTGELEAKILWQRLNLKRMSKTSNKSQTHALIQVSMGLQEHDLLMADETFSGKTVKKASSCVCWTNRLGQVSKYHLEIQKMQILTMNSKTFVAVAL